MNDSPNTRPLATGTLSWLGPILADRSLDPTETLLLIGLADHVDSNDECFVGIARLAEYARVSYATAKRRLSALEAQGRLERTRRRREDGNLSTYTWRLIRAPGLNLSPNHGSPGRALTMAHQGAPAEVPSSEPPSEDPSAPGGAGEDPERGFEVWWAAYPQRNGKRIGKAKSLIKWRAFALDTKRRVYAATVHYAAAVGAGSTIAKDPERFLAGRYWEDWVDGPGDAPLDAPRPSPVDGTAKAARNLEERNRRIRAGEACPLCQDVGIVVDEDDLARPCSCRKAS